MNKIFFFFALLPFLMSAQTDTAYTLKIDTAFYIVNKSVALDGSYSESARFIGNLDQYADWTQGAITRRASSLHGPAQEILKADRLWQAIIQQDNGFSAAYNRSPLTEVQMQYDSTLLMDTWQLELPGASPTPITFARNAQSKLRATWGGGTSKSAYLVSSTMRILNFNSAGAMNFYQIGPALWTDANRQIFIRRTAQNWTPWRPEFR